MSAPQVWESIFPGFSRREMQRLLRHYPPSERPMPDWGEAEWEAWARRNWEAWDRGERNGAPPVSESMVAEAEDSRQLPWSAAFRKARSDLN